MAKESTHNMKKRNTGNYLVHTNNASYPKQGRIQEGRGWNPKMRKKERKGSGKKGEGKKGKRKIGKAKETENEFFRK